jgi:PAS domain S-box-containing protein
MVLLTIGCLTISAVYILALRASTLHRQEDRLRAMSQIRARMAEAIAKHATGKNEDPLASVLEHFRESHSRIRAFGKTGEFIVAGRKNNQIIFLLHYRASAIVTNMQPPIPAGSKAAAAFECALRGESGTMTGLDYRRIPAMTAYEPVDGLNLAIIAKNDLSEISAPYLKALCLAAGISTLIILIGTLWFANTTAPLMRRLIRSEKKYRNLFETIPLGITVRGGDGRLTSINQTASRLLDIPMDNLNSQDFSTNPPVTLAGSPLTEEQYPSMRALRTGEPVENDIIGVRQPGESSCHWLATTAIPQFESGAKRPYEVIATFADITTQVQTQKLAAIERDLGLALSQAESLPQVLEHCLDAAIKISEMDCGGIYMVQPDGSMDLAAHKNLFTTFIRACSHYDAGSAHAQKAGKGEAFYLLADQTDPDIDARRREGIKAVAVVPVKNHGHVIACLSLGSHTHDYVPLNARATLERFIAQIGASIARMQAEEALRRQEAEYRHVIGILPIGVFIHRDGRIIMMNQAGAETMGAANPAQMAGTEIIPLVHPDYRNLFNTLIRNARSSNQASPLIEEKFIRLDGTPIDVEVTSIPVAYAGHTSLLTIFRDVTAQKQAEEIQAQRARENQRLLDGMPYPAMLVHKDHTIITANRAAIAAGAKTNGVCWRDFSICQHMPADHDHNAPTPPNSAPCGYCLAEQALITQSPVSAPCVSVGGRMFELHWVPLDANLYLHFIIDISDRMLAETQIRESEKMRSIAVLASGVAHEINNPISGIMGYAELTLDMMGADHPVSEYARETIHETKRVANIVKNLLRFARRDEDEHSTATVRDIIEGTLALMQTMLRHSRITLELDIPDGLPPIHCHIQQIQQVVMNLLTNARDALNEKYPDYHVDKKVLITARAFTENRAPWIRITIEDRGMGIPKGIQGRIFDAFFTTKPRDKGTGLGLSISTDIIKEHHGRIHIESEPGQFSRLHIELPAMPTAAAPVIPGAASQSGREVPA